MNRDFWHKRRGVVGRRRLFLDGLKLGDDLHRAHRSLRGTARAHSAYSTVNRQCGCVLWAVSTRQVTSMRVLWRRACEYSPGSVRVLWQRAWCHLFLRIWSSPMWCTHAAASISAWKYVISEPCVCRAELSSQHTHHKIDTMKHAQYRGACCPGSTPECSRTAWASHFGRRASSMNFSASASTAARLARPSAVMSICKPRSIPSFRPTGAVLCAAARYKLGRQ